MPQMAPLSWIIMYSTFTLLLVISLIKMYFMLKIEANQTMKMNKNYPSAPNLTWKW